MKILFSQRINEDMKVFKFGGATVKSAEAVQEVKAILDSYDKESLIVVISAMGKTTNALEKISKALYEGDIVDYAQRVELLKEFHYNILYGLFPEMHHPIFAEAETIFQKIIDFQHRRLPENYNFLYDQIVSYGEVLSTKIVSAYLSMFREDVCWKDARTFIRTDKRYRSAEVDWQKTQEFIDKTMNFQACGLIITQGFIGHTEEGFATTLGREGSDFTAGIIAYCTDAESVTIWKDVPGMFNADPRYFKDVIKLDKISYKEIIELSYYGASVIHPKTVQPLQNKQIPLFIKSFKEPENSGTIVQQSTDRDALIPSFIFKNNQILLSITTRDFSFVVEENLSDIFKKLASVGAQIKVMQNSAVSFTVCMDIDDIGLKNLIQSLQADYVVRYNSGVELVTIRHYDQETIDKVTKARKILMEQRTRDTVRIVMTEI